MSLIVVTRSGVQALRSTCWTHSQLCQCQAAGPREEASTGREVGTSETPWDDSAESAAVTALRLEQKAGP